MSNVLHTRALKKCYFDGDQTITVLNGIDFTLQSDETVAIIGASGCGKSTLMHILGGLDQPSSGEVYWHDQPVTVMPERQRCRQRNQHIGFVYQFHHLLPEFTAIENVSMPLLIRGERPAATEAIAKDWLMRVGLEQRVSHKVSALSGGERQRVALARALVTSPSVLLADEPTGNLDHHTAEQMLTILFDLKRELNTALVIVTHDETIAKQLNRCYQLIDGELQLS